MTPSIIGVVIMPPGKVFKRARGRASFDALFVPVKNPNSRQDEYLWDAGDIPRDADRRYWWTVVDVGPDPPFQLEAGIHRVNRIGLVQCINAWGGNAADHPNYIY